MEQPGSAKFARGKIYLIPSALGPEGTDAIPDSTRKIINDLFFFIVENERSARRFLRSIGYTRDFDEVILQKTERDEDFSAGSLLVNHLFLGHPAGVLSEAGCPGIADPGAAVVRWLTSRGSRWCRYRAPLLFFSR
jgi:16S rRNA (cytidine1402-2'-O)-methyltransferase